MARSSDPTRSHNAFEGAFVDDDGNLMLLSDNRMARVDLGTSAGVIAGDPFLPVWKSDGNELEAAAGANRWVRLNPLEFTGIRYLKLRSGRANRSVVQSADRTLRLAARSVF